MNDIIIFAGQSNMEGQSERLIDDSVVHGAYEYRYATDEMLPLCDPFGENLCYDGKEGAAYEDYMGMTWHEKHVFGGSAYGNTSLIPEFCRTFIKYTGHGVTAVGAAKGAADIDYFMPHGKWYEMTVKKTARAINKTSDHSGNTYLIWLQGESDAIIGRDTDDYIKRIKTIAHALQTDIGLTKFCIIRVGRFTGDERDTAIIETQNRVCTEDGLFLMLTEKATDLNEKPEYMNPYVGGHFSALGLQTLGKESAKTLARYVTKN